MERHRNTVSLRYTCPVTVVVDMDTETVEVILVTLTGMRMETEYSMRAKRAADVVARSFETGEDPRPIVA